MKGNLVVGQSGGPTAVINSSLCGVIQEAMRHDAIGEIYGMAHGVQGLLNDELIDLRAQSAETVDGLRGTPGAALGSCRHKLSEAEYERTLDVIRARMIRYFLYIGGNDSADTTLRIGQLARDRGHELQTMGVPKTIDNDLVFTDHCPGYGSAARFVALATRDSGRDTESIGIVDAVKIIEIMGRNTGWLTAATALARESEQDAPHLVYVPERPLKIDAFLQSVATVHDRLGHVVVTVCEGTRGPDGELLAASDAALDTDTFGHPQMGGVAEFLCRQVGGRLKLKARADKPGTLQRVFMSCASPVDVVEAYLVGKAAVQYIVKGVSDQMVILQREAGHHYSCVTGLAPLAAVANLERRLPDDLLNEKEDYPSQGFLAYVRPLIGPPLPLYARLRRAGF